MTIVKIISVTLFALIVLILLKSVNSEQALFASIAVNIGITVFSILFLKPVFEYVRQLNDSALYSNLFEIMFKSAGVALLCSFASELCRDAGYANLGSKIELCSKCTLLGYTLPIIQKLFDYAKEFIV